MKIGETWRLSRTRYDSVETTQGVVRELDRVKELVRIGERWFYADPADGVWEKIADTPRQEPPVGSVYVTNPGTRMETAWLRKESGHCLVVLGTILEWEDVPAGPIHVYRSGWISEVGE